MKFWQLLQFAKMPALLVDADFEGKWPWLVQWLRDLRQIVGSQDRDKLDAELPQELVIAVLEKSNVQFEFTRKYLRCGVPPTEESFSAVEAYLRFGGHAMSEAYEYGLYEILET